jgi:hypothetical protein
MAFRRDYQQAVRNNLAPLECPACEQGSIAAENTHDSITFMKTQFTELRRLPDSELLARVHSIAQTHRQASACLIAHLAELERRELYLPEGCSSMFTYCTQILRFSEQEAYTRIRAGRVAVRFPVVLDRLTDGSLNMTAVVLLAPHLTESNHEELFAAARHKTRHEVEKLIAALRPLPAVPTILRKLPARKGEPQNAETLFSENAGNVVEKPAFEQSLTANSVVSEFQSGGVSPTRTSTALSAPTALSRPAIVLPLAPQLYKLQVTITEETQQKLKQAQELIRHQIPDGSTAKILDRALDLLVEKLKKQKFGGEGRKRRKSTGGPPTSSKHPSALNDQSHSRGSTLGTPIL